MRERLCPVGGYQAAKDHWCQHTVGKCANCKGPHFAQVNACPKKKAARGDAKGWRSPSPTWRRRGKTSPPEEPPASAEEIPEGGVVEKAYESASEGTMEQGHGADRAEGGGTSLAAPRTPPQV